MSQSFDSGCVERRVMVRLWFWGHLEVKVPSSGPASFALLEILVCWLWKATQYLVQQDRTILSWFWGYKSPVFVAHSSVMREIGHLGSLNTGLASKWSQICLPIVPLFPNSYNLMHPTLLQWFLSHRGGILSVQFISRDHSNSRDSTRPRYLYLNMRLKIICYYVPPRPKPWWWSSWWSLRRTEVLGLIATCFGPSCKSSLISGLYLKRSFLNLVLRKRYFEYLYIENKQLKHSYYVF